MRALLVHTLDAIAAHASTTADKLRPPWPQCDQCGAENPPGTPCWACHQRAELADQLESAYSGGYHDGWTAHTTSEPPL